MKYRVIDLLQRSDVVIHPSIQRRTAFPFRMDAARRFFQNFRQESFEFDHAIGHILIHDGKENAPRHSFASGWIFRERVEVADVMTARGQQLEPIGAIQFECGPNYPSPVIRVSALGAASAVAGQGTGEGSTLLYPCVHCGRSFDPGDVPWTCPKCGHLDRHWDATLNCEQCGFSPDQSTEMACPDCGGRIRIFSIFFHDA